MAGVEVDDHPAGEWLRDDEPVVVRAGEEVRAARVPTDGVDAPLVRVQRVEEGHPLQQGHGF